MPDKLCWQYTPKQIVYLFELINRREVRETNLKYRMILATRLQDPPEKFLEIVDRKDKKQPDTEESESDQAGKAGIGVASEKYTKNFNPDLKIIRHEENQEGD